jgi:AcrR family transcriptional regulator
MTHVDRRVSANGALSTKEQILRAARLVLQRDGVGNLTIRSVAAEAEVNLALIHYHFHSRDGLLLAALEDLNADLLARQRGMYDQQDMTLADKWRQAVAFYHQDLESGYVRTLLELAGHGYSNPQMAERVRSVMDAWQKLLQEVIAGAADRLRLASLEVEPDEMASMLVSFWYGMEQRHLLGVTEEESHLWQILERIGHWIDRLEQGEV